MQPDLNKHLHHTPAHVCIYIFRSSSAVCIFLASRRTDESNNLVRAAYPRYVCPLSNFQSMHRDDECNELRIRVIKRRYVNRFVSVEIPVIVSVRCNEEDLFRAVSPSTVRQLVRLRSLFAELRSAAVVARNTLTRGNVGRHAGVAHVYGRATAFIYKNISALSLVAQGKLVCQCLPAVYFDYRISRDKATLLPATSRSVVNFHRLKCPVSMGVFVSAIASADRCISGGTLKISRFATFFILEHCAVQRYRGLREDKENEYIYIV